MARTSKLWRFALFGIPITGAAALFFAGIIVWGGFNTAMEATNTLGFCISCHEMKDNVYNEYTKTIHYQNRTGVRATCSDCHVPDPWVHKVVRKVEATKELYHKVIGSVDTPEKFDAKRLQLARKVWLTMKRTDSRECRNCHDFQSMAPEFQRPRARTQHLNAFKVGQTCIDCHKGIAHSDVRNQLTEEQLEELEKPNPAFVRAVPASYLESLKRVVEKEKQEAAEKEKQQAELEKSIKQRVATAVASAIAETKSTQNNTGSDQDTSSVAGKSAVGNIAPVSWDNIPAQTITLFYPGQASFEWVQTGKDHGGARAFAKLGDRCASCHAKEVRDMGAKIVSGEKAEPTPIEGKRGHVDIKLQAVHDAENFYLRFQWPDAPHTPASFVDGGKMDPKNQVKLAMMIADNTVEHVEQAGCWVTCHHDSRLMPHHPDSAAMSGAGDLVQQIDIAGGITKYLAESRTKVEIKGRRGKKRGGWDNLKPAGDIAELSKTGVFMDLLRYRSGDESENGYVLAERTMKDGNSLAAEGALSEGIWTVVIKRPLAASGPGDIAVEPGKIYTVGFALHDDFTSARFHHVSLEFQLGMDNPEAEINVAKTQ